MLYGYDSGGRLSQVTDVNNGVWKYGYDTSNRMTTITDARNILYLQNFYDSNGRVYKQIQADNSTYLFSYTLDSAGNVTRTDVTDPRNNVRSVTFNPPPVYPDGFRSGGTDATDTAASGTSIQQTTTINRGQAGANPAEFVQSTTDALGRTTSYTYDAKGNVTSITGLAGTSQAVTTAFTYDSLYDRLTSIIDPLGHVTTFGYDSSGNLTALTDPLGSQSIFGYNSFGQLTSVTDPLGNPTQFSYVGADLSSVTEPQGQISSFFSDAAGRLISTTNALNQTTRYEYNNLNERTKIIDALQQSTSFGYDADGNLTSVTDARNAGTPTTYVYDNMDRLYTHSDPLGRIEYSLYDGNGNLTQFIDRRGKVTTFQYDALNRRTFTGFGTVGTSYESAIGLTYDAGNRLRQVSDSVIGNITRNYDDFDRLTSETTPQGTISYNYDNAGRRSTMTVAGQPAVIYAWDDANRLVQINQGGTTVGFNYDTGGRRTTLTLPNGIAAQYSYDRDSRLTGISYQLAGAMLGDLSYNYDAANRQTQMTGSFARVGLPPSVSSSAYDAANELTSWNGATLSYDANGNLIGDGTNTYTWNARNQLVSFNAATFQYDTFGRRSKNGLGVNFLYDGLNPVQELNGATPTANLLSGGVDQVFQRTDSSGAASFLSDALGSTLALTDSTGSLQTQYTYEAFGHTSSSGLTSSNALQYAGRENEGNGLYYYRARYYSPQFQRFVSEDPIGILGGTNLYRYVANDPINNSDPSGALLSPWHRRITREAAINAGWTPEDADALAQAVVDFDFLQGSQDTTPEAANGHAMAGKKQSCQDAYAGAQRQIADSARAGSLKDIARALHIIQDAESESHDFKSWNGGNSIGWPTDPLFDHVPSLGHMIRDAWPSSQGRLNALVNSQQFLRDLRENTSALNYPTNYLPQNPCAN